MYKQRYSALLKSKGVKYVTLFKNHGSAGGTSIIHTHTQLVAYNKVPKLVQDEIAAVKKNKIRLKSAKGEDDEKKKFDHKCAFCEIAKQESSSPRTVFQNSSFTVFCPYASRYNYEVWLFSKKHIKSIAMLNDSQLIELAEALHFILKGLKELNCGYDYFIHTSPKLPIDGELHFHIEICPRIATWAGFELSTEEVINTVTPEDAAEFYRNAQR